MLTAYRIAEDLACGVVAVALWELGRWVWMEVQARRAIDEMLYCPGAEDYDDEDWIS